MDFPVRFVTREGCPLARPGGDPRVQTHRQLQSEIRSLVPGRIEKHGIDVVERPDVGRGAYDLDARLRQKLAPTPRLIARLGSPEDHPGHPGLQQCLGTRGCLAMMATRLEAHIGGGPTGSISSRTDRVHFRVRAAVFLVPSFPHALPITRQDTPDHRIGMHPAPPPARQRGGLQKPLPVRLAQRHVRS